MTARLADYQIDVVHALYERHGTLDAAVAALRVPRAAVERAVATRRREQWTRAEKARARRMRRSGVDDDGIAVALGRTPHAVRRALRIRGTAPPARAWTTDEERRIREDRAAGRPVRATAEALGRTVEGVQSHVAAMIRGGRLERVPRHFSRAARAARGDACPTPTPAVVRAVAGREGIDLDAAVAGAPVAPPGARFGPHSATLERVRLVAALARDGWRDVGIARSLTITPGRVGQIRRAAGVPCPAPARAAGPAAPAFDGERGVPAPDGPEYGADRRRPGRIPLVEVRAACAEAGLDRQAAISRDRRPEVTRRRHEAWRILRDAGHSYPRIGRAFGRDHSTVVHGVRVARERRAGVST